MFRSFNIIKAKKHQSIMNGTYEYWKTYSHYRTNSPIPITPMTEIKVIPIHIENKNKFVTSQYYRERVEKAANIALRVVDCALLIGKIKENDVFINVLAEDYDETCLFFDKYFHKKISLSKAGILWDNIIEAQQKYTPYKNKKKAF